MKGFMKAPLELFILKKCTTRSADHINACKYYFECFLI
jgi:hypothetical protein